MARHNSGGGDLLEKFFDSLPSLNSRMTVDDLTKSPVAFARVAKFAQEAQRVPASSLDEDCRLLLQRALKSFGLDQRVDLFFCAIATLATEKIIRADDNSAKACYLRHFRWMARGRKDEESPYQPRLQQPAEPVDHAHLPKNPGLDKCAGCGSTEGKMTACVGCLVRTDGHATFVTAYCGKSCQVAHWKEHKISCKTLQKLYRAASTFRAVFTLWMEFTSDPCGHSTKITEEDGMVNVTSVTSAMEQTLGFRGDPILAKFPDLDGPSAPSEKARTATLLRSSCRETTGTARSLFELFIRPTIKSVDKISLNPRNMHKPIHESKQGINGESHADYLALWNHEVLRVTLPSDQLIVMDPSGLQFGWTEIISPVDQYVKHRVLVVQNITREPFPVPPEFMPDPISLTIKNKRREAAESLTSAIQAHLDQDGTSLAKFLEMKNDVDFKTAQSALLAKAKAALEDNLSSLQQGDLYKFYLSPDFELAAADDPELCQKLKKVWLSKAEYEKIKDFPAVLRRTYIKRYRKAMGR